MDAAATARAVEHFGRARLEHRVVTKPPPELVPQGQPGAYALMKSLHRWFIDHGLGETVGYKIGCTTAVQQAHVGIDRPLGGGVLNSLVHRHEAHLRFADYYRLGIETELAVRIGEPPPLAGAPYDRENITPYVSEVMAAVEIVDERYEDYRSWPVEALITDDFFNAGCVLGDPVLASSVDLAGMAGRTVVNGEEFGRGIGGDVMGHPYNALSLLTNVLAEAGVTLQKGEIVLTGSVVQTHWPDGPGTEYLCTYDPPLGELRIHVE